MTNVTEGAMFDAEEKAGNNTQRGIWMILCGVGIVMLLGAIAGYLSQHQDEGGGAIGTTGMLVLGVIVTIIFVLAFAIWKLFQRVQHSGERIPAREKLNYRILIGCGLLGGFIGVTLAVADMTGDNDGNIFGGGPLSPMIAILLSVAIGVVLPAVTFYWHKNVIDEQEEAAYRAGALIAIYAFWFIAPVWWLLWRGGMLPVPDGVALYLMTNFVALVVWFWKKYR